MKIGRKTKKFKRGSLFRFFHRADVFFALYTKLSDAGLPIITKLRKLYSTVFKKYFYKFFQSRGKLQDESEKFLCFLKPRR